MRNIDRLLAAYAESHRNPTNKLIHNLAVPLIYFSALGLIWTIPVPEWLVQYDINWAYVISLPVLYYYFSLSGPIGAVMTLFTIVSLLTIEAIGASSVSVWQVCLGIFVIMWVLQFVGHKIEGKKPSFFEDLRFLLIGPAWVFAHWLGYMKISY
jgi:uncharacterized membrane protein YGL010W